MRFSRICVSNFKGAESVEMDELLLQPLTVITGFNGSGKSSILEALAVLRSGFLPEWAPELVSSGAREAVVEVSFSLTDSEFAQVSAYAQRNGTSVDQEDIYSRRLVLKKDGTRGYSGSPAAEIVFDADFRKHYGFAGIEFISTPRDFCAVASPTVDLASLSPSASFPRRGAGQFSPIGRGDFSPFGDISVYLASLDYKYHLETRQGGSVRDDYEEISSAFFHATGKSLLRPSLRDGTAVVEVEAEDGRRHGLAGLSGGERGLLGICCLLQHLAKAEGIILIDEPEIHLHPGLQASLMKSIKAACHRSQVFLVTHSPTMVAMVTPPQVFEMRRAAKGENQAKRAADLSEMATYVSNMGVTQADLILKQVHVIVEGEDVEILEALFPQELGRAHITSAGNCHEVMSHCRALAAAPPGIPWVGLRDRDLLTAAEINRIKAEHKNIHIWPRRAIESMFLDARLLAAIVSSLGEKMSEAEAARLLRESADPLMDDVARDMLVNELNRRFPPPKPFKGAGFEQGLVDFYHQSAQVNEQRARAVATMLADQKVMLSQRWDAEWIELVDPKKLIGALSVKLGIFRTKQHLLNALVTRAAQDPSIRPKGLEEFRLVLVDAISKVRAASPRRQRVF